MAAQINVVVKYEAVRVDINGLLHLHIPRPILGVQSWKKEREGKYVIQFTLTGGAEMTADYDDSEKWQAVLAGLDKVL